jgi:type VI secretion system protein ImpJ
MFFPVQWHEGMLLGPHHFQTERHRIERFFQYHLKASLPFPYGLFHLHIDPILLSKGVFKVLEIDGIFEDGLCFSYRHELHHHVFEIASDLKHVLISSSHRQKIAMHLAIAPQGQGELSSDNPRYVPYPEESIEDLNTPNNMMPVPLLCPRIYVYDDKTLPKGLVTMPIALIEVCQEGFTRLPYTYPCFFLDNKSHVVKLAQDVAIQIRQKLNYLTLRYQNEMLALDTIRILLQSLCEMETYLSCTSIQPHVLHQISTRTLSILLQLKVAAPPLLPSYHHHHIDQSLTPILDVILLLLSTIEQEFDVLTFDQTDSHFEIMLKDTYIGGQNKIYIGVKGSKNLIGHALEEWCQEALMSSKNHLDEAKTRRISGAMRRLLPYQEAQQFTPIQGVLVFEIKIDDPFIDLNDTFVIMHPRSQTSTIPSEIVLYQKLIS